MGKNLSTKEVAEILGLSENCLAKWRWSNVGPSFLKVGRTVRYRAEDIENYLNARAVSTKDQPSQVG